MITVGLDFGTHQTKVCIENKKGTERSYSFMKFEDATGTMQFTLPSIISIGKDRRLNYGYITEETKGTVIRYFKQATFRNNKESLLSQKDAMLYSIWYLSYIIFDLEAVYGQDFVIQMGAPTDSSHVDNAKSIAVQLLASAYKLVEDLFSNDKEAFLNSTIEELLDLTNIIPYSKKIKENYGILVFPEAYACLNPLVNLGKVSRGMSLMVDIGGGTTDISFFTIENGLPQVYDFFSINKGLNFLTATSADKMAGRIDSNVKSSNEITKERILIFESEIREECQKLIKRIISHFQSQTQFNVERIKEALKTRPIIYCGGGSTFQILRKPYAGFSEIHLISSAEWDVRSIRDMGNIRDNNLVPILSTSYGLSISRAHDNIKKKPLQDLFAHMKGLGEDYKLRNSEPKNDLFGRAFGGFSYSDDFDAWK